MTHCTLYENSPFNTVLHTNLSIRLKKKRKTPNATQAKVYPPQNIRPRFLVSFSFSPPLPRRCLKVLIKLPSHALQRYSSTERAATANGANLTSDEDEKVRRNRRSNCDGGNYPRPSEKSRAASFFLELLQDA